jgi:hypothetical protein
MDPNPTAPESGSSFGSRVRRFWWLLLLVVIFLVAGGIFTSKTGNSFLRKFSAMANIEFSSNVASVSDMAREVGSMTSNDSLITALKEGGLATEPEFQGDEAEVARMLTKAVRVTLRRGTRLADIEVLTDTAPSAVKLANSVAETYVKQATVRSSPSMTYAPPRVDLATKASPMAALGGRRKLILLICGAIMVLLLLAILVFRRSSH